MFTIKNNNLYYYNYKITFKYSFLLVPIFIYIFIYRKNLIKYFSPLALMVFCVGLIDSYEQTIKTNLNSILFINIIGHSFALFPLTNYKEYFKFNFITYLLLLLYIITIYILPYRPYIVTKDIVILILLTIYFMLFIYHYFN